VEGLRGSEPLRRYLEASLPARPGIQTVTASVLTGNVLVISDRSRGAGAVARLLERVTSEYRSGAGKRPGTRSAISMGFSPRLAESLTIEPWHVMEAEDVQVLFCTSRSAGLSRAQAFRNLVRFGPNVLRETRPRAPLSLLVEQFRSLPVALLGAAALLSALTGGLLDAAAILSVVGLNAAVGYVTESRSGRVIRSLRRIVQQPAEVTRDGQRVTVGSEEVVPGDLLVLKPGSYVPADARVLEARRLTIDESALTGESMPVSKTAGGVRPASTPLAERSNMVFKGTFVTGGQGTAVVVGTGRHTEIGKIQDVVSCTAVPNTPIQTQLNRLSNQLVAVGCAACGVVFGLGALRRYALFELLKNTLSLAVCAVPEGLPAVATTTLAIGIRNMRRHGVLIRRLEAVETLGCLQTVCLDKTGTITENRMSVVAVYAGGRTYTRRGRVLRGTALNGSPLDHAEVRRLLEVSVLCNETRVEEDGDGHRLIGSPTERALVEMALESGISIRSLRASHPVTQVRHRSETRPLMTTWHATRGKRGFVALKGSPVEVLSLCGSQLVDGRLVPLHKDERLAIETANERMAGDALRVLGVAYKDVANGHESFDSPRDCVWLGLVGMADPLRKSVKDVIRSFHRAGVDTVMITGDQSATAYAIARELDLSAGEDLRIVDSTQLSAVDSDVLQRLADGVHVFARVSPVHKLQIVQSLQRAGRVVAMTGDGINDTPALKAADVGVAMGHGGTDIAREVADVVLEDDRLETMVTAISHGRTVHENIKKSIHFLLSTNLSEITVMLAGTAAGLGHPLTTMQLLWINLLSDVVPSLALALERPAVNVLEKPPREPGAPLFDATEAKRIVKESLVLSAGALGAYGYGLYRYGAGARTNTLGFMSLTAGQLIHALSCRSHQRSVLAGKRLPRNPALHGAVAGSLLLQGLTFTVPWLRRVLGVSRIGLADLAVIALGAALPLVVNEATKPAQEVRRVAP
jgi:Ca2+-transporting ATPase